MLEQNEEDDQNGGNDNCGLKNGNQIHNSSIIGDLLAVDKVFVGLSAELTLALEESVVSDGETVRFFVDAGDEAGDVRVLRQFSGLKAGLGRNDDFDEGGFAVVAGFVATNDGDFMRR